MSWKGTSAKAQYHTWLGSSSAPKSLALSPFSLPFLHITLDRVWLITRG